MELQACQNYALPSNREFQIPHRDEFVKDNFSKLGVLFPASMRGVASDELRPQ
jgi:hypothetical protein